MSYLLPSIEKKSSVQKILLVLSASGQKILIVQLLEFWIGSLLQTWKYPDSSFTDTTFQSGVLSTFEGLSFDILL